MGSLKTVKSAVLSAALLVYSGNLLAQTPSQNQALVPNTSQSTSQNPSLIEDAEFLNAIRKVNELQSTVKWNEQGVPIYVAQSPLKIGQTLSPQLKQLVDRFDFERKYDINLAFTYGTSIVLVLRQYNYAT